eukprot:CAMPEP_0204622786 /NCGR_PEP_ID=MMETSP0717-20131115/8476_1 /ASSEMBLY_ACC=CAM_ASM_000666 /TAXON_ID=230516 /ORGANISM="Chaetoceros curvisetus" /LENGTH=243 /DNA_ID=CAMNT_0051637629 /DNA_START=23 /DNA_END=751 /DNA_ORIENTATION=-
MKRFVIPLSAFLHLLLLPIRIIAFAPNTIVERIGKVPIEKLSFSSSPQFAVDIISSATSTLQHYEDMQLDYVNKSPIGKGGGTAALKFMQTKLAPVDREKIRIAVLTLVDEAHRQRAANSAEGRIILGICAENVDEALLGLKTWVPTLNLPRGLLHGMDVDGVPIPPEELGSVYVKYNTGGCMTFTEMRRGGMGFDALWRPGDAVLEMYDGDFRGVYFNLELEDREFRQFLLPTDLFLEDEEW